jgi:glycosyltransferase involved in cell wall biosynthesis
MHLLVVAVSFPSPENPYRGSFIEQQVLELAERVERITVLCPVPWAPRFLSWHRRFVAKTVFPLRYQMVDGRCEVLFPRYLKAPGAHFLSWTKAQWCRLIDRTIAKYSMISPVSIIHAHGGTVSGWGALQAAKRHELPCVVTYHGSEVHTMFANRQKGWKLCRDSFREADLNLPVSRALENILRSRIQPKGRCETLLLGVDRERFFPADEISMEPRVLFVGRVEEAKGAFDLLHAWSRVLALSPAARLTIVGPDCTAGRFMQEAQSLGITDSIEFSGALPGHRVAELMRSSRVFCLPSHKEGTPVSVMEALSSGLPVVATRVGGIPDIVVHGSTGLLVDKGDREQLGVSLVKLLNDRSDCMRMGRLAQEFAAAHLDINQTANRLVQLYHEAIKARSGSHGSQLACLASATAGKNVAEPSSVV